MGQLGLPPLEGMEDKYGQEGLQNKSDLKKLKQELGDLESKQQLVEEKLAKMQKEKLTGTVKEEETIKFPVKGVEQSIFRRDFKIQGVVGDPGQKEKLAYQALISQIEAGLTKGYSDKGVVSAVVRAVQPRLQLRSYLETMVDLTLPRLHKILRFHFHERNATELYQLLINIAQQPNEDPQSFLMRSLTVRQKITTASKELDSGIKYDASSVQSLFLHAVETGLADETICAKIRPLTQNPKVADEDLIGAMSLAISAEAEQSNKFNLTSKGKSVKVSTIESAAESNKRPKRPRAEPSANDDLRPVPVFALNESGAKVTKCTKEQKDIMIAFYDRQKTSQIKANPADVVEGMRAASVPELKQSQIKSWWSRYHRK